MRKITVLLALAMVMSACLMSCSKNDNDSSVTVQREYPVSGWERQTMMGNNGDILQSYVVRGEAYLSYGGQEYRIVATTITGNLYQVNIKNTMGQIVSTGRVIIPEYKDYYPIQGRQRLVLNANGLFGSSVYM